MNKQYEQADRIAKLILNQIFEVASETEKAELDSWKNESPENAAYIEEALQKGYLAKGLKELEEAEKRMSQLLREAGVPLLD